MLKPAHLILFVVILLWGPSLLGQGSWEKIDTPADVFLRALHFNDSLTGWAVGDSGTIIHTMTGGDSWQIQQSQLEHQIVDVYFLDEEKGWAVAQNYTSQPYGTIILKTDDAGETWEASNYPEENIFMNCILFLDSLNGWMGGSPHAIVNTADGGQTWQQASVDTSTLAFFPVLSIQFWDEQYGYASGGVFDIAGVTWRTSDGGESWYAIDVSDAPADEVHELYLFDSINVIGIGGDPDFAFGAAVIRTNDGGINWDYEEIGIQGNGFDIDFRTPDDAWAPMGPQQALIYSTDAGDTWTLIDSPENTEIFEITFPDSVHGYAAGRNGAFLKYNPPTGVSVDEADREVSLLRLGQNYPNPFWELTIIDYQLSINGFVTIKVLNSSGILIGTLVSESKQPGDYEAVFDGSGLPPGLYFYQLTVTSSSNGRLRSEMRKMVLKE
jgi:photosystem II stability/assembly factor-like uncharacterized protein